MNTHSLSKSTFVRGCNCTKSLYLYKKHSELITDIDEKQQAIFDSGHDIGRLAQELFPNGTDAKPENPSEFPLAVALTRKLMDEGCNIIYEAAFQYDGVLAATDILVRDGNNWSAYEVKGSTKVKEEYFSDTALQYYVITNSGRSLKDFSVIHLNNQYVKRGSLEVEKLFKMTSVKNEVETMQEFVKKKIIELKNIIQLNEVPKIKIRSYCRDPYECEFIDHCWDHIPKEHSVFTLNRIGASAFEMVEAGILTLDQIPTNYKLAKSPAFQLQYFKSGAILIEKKEISDFLGQFLYPLYFFDFETYMMAVPEFDFSRPYQQIPFQYSLHVLRSENHELEHFEFLGDGFHDPRAELIKKMIIDLGVNGSIITYNSSFEKTRLKELAEDFPQFAHPIESIINRIVDLMKPFQSRWYYHPGFEGSYSIKNVLPVLVPDLNYSSMEIQEGGTASLVYSLLRDQDSDTRIVQRKQLLDYCRLDTLAMVEILHVLRKI
ncbi:MAG: DUF2779 domain-containing protein [Bacteroidetes bacterium]|nr:DUF2779 domain-containing protein [Bacteroidota bacterium]